MCSVPHFLAPHPPELVGGGLQAEPHPPGFLFSAPPHKVQGPRASPWGPCLLQAKLCPLSSSSGYQPHGQQLGPANLSSTPFLTSWVVAGTVLGLPVPDVSPLGSGLQVLSVRVGVVDAVCRPCGHLGWGVLLGTFSQQPLLSSQIWSLTLSNLLAGVCDCGGS